MCYVLSVVYVGIGLCFCNDELNTTVIKIMTYKILNIDRYCTGPQTLECFIRCDKICRFSLAFFIDNLIPTFI